MRGRDWRKIIVDRDLELCFDHIEELSDDSSEFITYLKMRMIEDNNFANRMSSAEFNRLQEIAHNINYVENEDEI